MHTRERGFSLIELMVAVAIAAILITLSINLRDMVADNRRAAVINDFLSAVNYTRSQAITRSTSVTLCKSANGATCTTGGWEQGWIIFTDSGADGIVNGTDSTTDGTVGLLQVREAIRTGVTLRNVGAASSNRITFNALGTVLTSSTNMTVTICDQRGFATGSRIHARQIVVALGGRSRAITPTSAGSCT